MKSSKTSTMKNRRERRSVEEGITLPSNDVVDISNKLSENTYTRSNSCGCYTKAKWKHGMKVGKSKPTTPSIKRDDSIPKIKGKEPQKNRGQSKRKR